MLFRRPVFTPLRSPFRRTCGPATSYQQPALPKNFSGSGCARQVNRIKYRTTFRDAFSSGIICKEHASVRGASHIIGRLLAVGLAGLWLVLPTFALPCCTTCCAAESSAGEKTCCQSSQNVVEAESASGHAGPTCPKQCPCHGSPECRCGTFQAPPPGMVVESNRPEEHRHTGSLLLATADTDQTTPELPVASANASLVQQADSPSAALCVLLCRYLC